VQLKNMGKSEIADEVVGARPELANCGIPESSIVGLRAPYLEIKGDVWEVLQENGFQYDR